MNSTYINISFAMYFLATLFYFARLFFSTDTKALKNKIILVCARSFISIGVISLTAYILIRCYIAKQPPLSNMFESLILFAWTIGLICFFTDVKYKIKSVPAVISLLSLVFLGYASFLDKEIAPLLPALKSNWLIMHVLTCFVGYAALTCAFVTSIIFLVQSSKKEEQSQDTKKLDRISYKMITFGFCFLGLGIITGSVWANSAWGTYWSWDPKETWSLITWFVYALYLHVRLVKGWKGRKAAWLSVIGFLAMLFTYFGVNYLLSGLHSYA